MLSHMDHFTVNDVVVHHHEWGVFLLEDGGEFGYRKWCFWSRVSMKRGFRHHRQGSKKVHIVSDWVEPIRPGLPRHKDG